MAAKKQQSHRSGKKVLEALASLPLNELTPDEILVALKHEGVDSLSDLVAKLKELRKDFGDAASQSPKAINLQLLSRQTPKEKVAAIAHRAPKVPFVLNGTLYDPEDIARFNGRELHFVVGSRSLPDYAFLAFEERDVLVNWLQVVYLSKLTGLNVTPSQTLGGAYTPGVPYTGPGRGGGAAPPNVGGLPWLPYVPKPPENMRMFAFVGYYGSGLQLPPGGQFDDLRAVHRHGNVSWDDCAKSIDDTTSLCAYWEHPASDYYGQILLVVPNNPIPDLSLLGRDDMISAAQNFGP